MGSLHMLLFLCMGAGCFAGECLSDEASAECLGLSFVQMYAQTSHGVSSSSQIKEHTSGTERSNQEPETKEDEKSADKEEAEKKEEKEVEKKDEKKGEEKVEKAEKKAEEKVEKKAKEKSKEKPKEKVEEKAKETAEEKPKESAEAEENAEKKSKEKSEEVSEEKDEVEAAPGEAEEAAPGEAEETPDSQAEEAAAGEAEAGEAEAGEAEASESEEAAEGEAGGLEGAAKGEGEESAEEGAGHGKAPGWLDEVIQGHGSGVHQSAFLKNAVKNKKEYFKLAKERYGEYKDHKHSNVVMCFMIATPAWFALFCVYVMCCSKRDADADHSEFTGHAIEKLSYHTQRTGPLGWLGWCMESPWFRMVILSMVLVDLFCLFVIGSVQQTDWLNPKYKIQGQNWASCLRDTNIIILCVFIIEQFLHSITHGKLFFHHFWYVLDLVGSYIALVAACVLTDLYPGSALVACLEMLPLLRMWNVVALIFDLLLVTALAVEQEEEEMEEEEAVAEAIAEEKTADGGISKDTEAKLEQLEQLEGMKTQTTPDST